MHLSLLELRSDYSFAKIVRNFYKESKVYVYEHELSQTVNKKAQKTAMRIVYI